MWGSAFADLAKKVEEQASALSAFNLDAMQKQDDGATKTTDDDKAASKSTRTSKRSPPQQQPRHSQQTKQQPPVMPPLTTPPARFDSSGSASSSNFVGGSTAATAGTGTPNKNAIYGLNSMLTPPQTSKQTIQQKEVDFFSSWGSSETSPKKQPIPENLSSPALQTVAAALSGKQPLSPKQDEEKQSSPSALKTVVTADAADLSNSGGVGTSSKQQQQQQQSSPKPTRKEAVVMESPEQKTEKPVAVAEEKTKRMESPSSDEKAEKPVVESTATVGQTMEMPSAKVVVEPKEEAFTVVQQNDDEPPEEEKHEESNIMEISEEQPVVAASETKVHHEQAFDSFLDVDEEEEPMAREKEEEEEPTVEGQSQSHVQKNEKEKEDIAHQTPPPTHEDNIIAEETTVSTTTKNDKDDETFHTPSKPADGDNDDDNFETPAFQTPAAQTREASINDEDDDVALLSPDIKQVVSEISKTSVQFDQVLHTKSLMSPNSDNGSIGVELNNLADSEEVLRQELLKEEEEEKSTTHAVQESTAIVVDKDEPVVVEEIMEQTDETAPLVTENAAAVPPEDGYVDETTTTTTTTTTAAEEPLEAVTEAVESPDSEPEEEEQPALSCGMDRGDDEEEDGGGGKPLAAKQKEQPQQPSVIHDDGQDGKEEEDAAAQQQQQTGMASLESTTAVDATTNAAKDEDSIEEAKPDAATDDEAPPTSTTAATDTSLSAENVMGMFSSQLQMLSPQMQMLSSFTTTTPETTKSANDDKAAAVGDMERQPELLQSGDANEDESADNKTDSAAIPDHVMAMFSGQIQRLEEYHASEMKEMQQRHEAELEKANKHDACFKKMRALEKEWQTKINEGEEQISTLLQTNEGMGLKMDVLQRELDGTKAMLDKRESDFGQATQTHSRDVHLVEQKLKDVEGTASASAAEVDRLREELKTSKEELKESNEAFTKLKGRVKVVATELKDRRVECRGLHNTVAELNTANESLETQIDNLQNQLKEQNRVRMESNEGMAALRSRVEEMESELRLADKKLKERDAVGEKALASYKKKAQSALAAANARSSAANHAREEAELEASAIRTSGEQALERARVAERNAKETVMQAEKKTLELEEQNKALMNTLAEANESWKRSEEELQVLRTEMQGSDSSREKLISEIAAIGQDLEEEKSKTLELTHELNDRRATCNALRNEVDMLREEVQRSSVATPAAVPKDSTADMGAGGVSPALLKDETGNVHGTSNGVKLFGDDSESEATITRLRQELEEANEAIDQLKEALKGSLAKSTEAPQYPEEISSPRSYDSYGSPDRHSTNRGNQESDATPLFYALEKQAELNTARDEITRLANLLGDAESAKMEAYDAMEDMRIKMEEAEARLRRHEKLGQRGSSSSRNIDGTRGTPHRPALVGSRPGVSMAQNGASTEEWNGNDSQVNLEYLKNVMLSYLNAKTTAERRALVPVLAAVLELTPDEHAKAMRNVEESGELNGVGNAFLESLGSKVHQLM